MCSQPGTCLADFKAVADFRKDNGLAIHKVCKQFGVLCRDINLLDGNLIAIDGIQLKAVNFKVKNYTCGKLHRKLGEIDKAIDRYLGQLDRADEVFEQTSTALPGARMERTLRKLKHLQKEAKRCRSIEKRMDETGETHARSMATTPRMPRVVGCNIQTAVEAENHLIVAHEVTMPGYDRDAPSLMAMAARNAMALDRIEALADKGYYKNEEILTYEQAGISVVFSKTSDFECRGVWVVRSS